MMGKLAIGDELVALNGAKFYTVKGFVKLFEELDTSQRVLKVL